MHGAADNNPSQQFNGRYAAAPRHNEEQHHQPSTSSSHHMQPTTMSLMRTPTTSSAGRPAPSLVRIGQPIKVGDSILQPAGTLVFSSQGDGSSWTSGHKVMIRNHNNVVQANFLPIGMTLQSSNGSWLFNQQPITTTSTSSLSNPNTTSSATPDSGIQSVPTSPPSPRYELTNERDDVEIADEDEDDGPTDFTDMPCLKPADEDDCYDIPSTSAGPPVVEPTSVTPVPPPSASREDLNSMNPDELFAISIEKNMDLDEIVQRLISFHPEKASDIAALIKKKCAEETKKKKDMEAEVSSTTPSTPARVTRKRTRVARNTNSPDVTTSTTDDPPTAAPSPVEDIEVKTPKRRGRKPKKKRNFPWREPNYEPKKMKSGEDVPSTSSTPSIPSVSSVSTPTPSESARAETVLFRLKVRQMLEKQLEQQTEKMVLDMEELRLGHSTVKPGGKRKESFVRQLAEQSKKIKKGYNPKRLKMFMKEEEEEEVVVESKCKEPKEEEEVVPKVRSRLHSRRSRVEESEETNFTVEEKYNGEYYEIPKSIPSSDAVIPLWRAPSLTCGCTKGACTSDMDCLNRAMRVQCNSECSVSYCSNRRFWKEDNNKLCISNGPRSRRVLKTKVARRAGEFLCEYAGEVIMGEEALRRCKERPDSRIIAITSQLFVDATTRANIARFVKHSCKPNSRLEVWSVNGLYRAGVFALVDLATNIEITVDKSGLVPVDQPCTCGTSGCKKIIRGVRTMGVVDGDESEKIDTRRFLPRNRRKTIERTRLASGLPAILTAPEPSEPSSLLQMKKVLAAFAFRVRRIDGSMPRSLLPFYTNICKFLKTSRDRKPAEFIGLFRKWLDAIDDDDLERAFVAIESHYLSSSLMASARCKKQKENAPRARAPSTSCHSPVPGARRNDADLSYLDSNYLINSYDPDVAWESYRAHSNDNAVRCVCGALDEDGEMVQCDQCDFWLHMDCVQYQSVEQEEYKCDFCLGKQPGNRPNADVKITIPLDVRFEHCDYYRALMNRRGMQVRLNETVYVGKTLPDDHKAMLRNLKEEKKGGKPLKPPSKSLFPEAPTDPLPLLKVDRKEARIFRVERLFVCPGNNRFVFGSFYAWPHETYADTGRVFSRREVFATPYYETLPLDEVIGRCLVVDTATWSKGRPRVPRYKEDDVYLCEMQIGKNQRVFEKVPSKNRYPINTQPYVFTKFSQPKKIVRDFRPYDPSNPSPKPPRVLPTPEPPPPSSSPLPKVNWRKLSRRHIDRALKRLSSAPL